MIATMTTVIGIFSKLLSSSKSGTPLEMVPWTQGEKAVMATRGSMVTLLKPFIIEPAIVVTEDMSTYESIQNVIDMNIDLFTSFYVNSFKIITEIHGVNPDVAFNLLASNKSVTTPTGAITKYITGTEDLKNSSVLPIKRRTSGLEALLPNTSEADVLTMNSVTASAKKQDVLDIPPIIYREVEIKYEWTDDNSNKRSFSIPVMVKANITIVDFERVLDVLSVYGTDKTMTRRYHQWRSGAISTMNFLFAGDIVTEYKKKRLDNPLSLIEYVNKRGMTSTTNMTSNKALGFDRYYGFLILSSSQLEAIEAKLRNKMSNLATRDRLFEAMKSMMVSVVDRDYKRVVLYIKDLPNVTTVGIDTLKSRKPSNGGSMSEFSELLRGMIFNGKNF